MEHWDNKTGPKLPNPFGSRYNEASLAKIRFANEDASAIAKWIRDRKDFLVFTGTPGCGKTYTCAAIWNHNSDHNLFTSMRAWREADLLARIRTSIDNGRDYLENAKELCDDELIIIDDFGSTGINEWRNEVYFNIIDFRSSSRKPTIITTNMDKNELAVEMGHRIYSRLMAAENTFLEMKAIDIRLNPL